MKKLWAQRGYNQIHNHEKVLYLYEKLGRNFYYYYLHLRNLLTRKQTPMNFVYMTNSQCTLRCKECHTYIPYFSQDMQYMVDFETFKIEIDKLLKSLDIIPSFRFQGGETLLVKDLAKMVEYACSKKQIQHIQIIANGTVVPSAELIEAMKNPKVLLSLSDYSCNEELRNRLKYDEIIKLCEAKGVNVKHWLTKAGDLWVGRNYIKDNDKIDKELAIKNLAVCHCSNSPKVIMFYRGKLYICPPAVYLANANPNFNIPEDEVIDVVNTPSKQLTQKINKLFSKEYYTLCGRCNAYENKDVKHKPGVQI